MTLNPAPAPAGPNRAFPGGQWARTHIDAALRLCWTAALVVFAGSIALLRTQMLLGVAVGFGLARAVLLVAEHLAESVFLENISTGNYMEAVRAPGISRARQVDALRRVVANHADEPAAEDVAAYVRYCLDCGLLEFAPVMRAYEDTWGHPPAPGPDSGIIRRLLQDGFHFTTAINAPPEPVVMLAQGIPWERLWRDRLWKKLREQHPGESLPRLALRLYATEWQRTLAPIWVILAMAATVVLARPWPGISESIRGSLFYALFIVLGAAACWLAFVLRPAAFNASLLVGDVDRCARWVLESTEGKHFLVSALGSGNPKLRREAVNLLIWHDALLTANLTLPEGMRAFLRREGK